MVGEVRYDLADASHFLAIDVGFVAQVVDQSSDAEQFLPDGVKLPGAIHGTCLAARRELIILVFIEIDQLGQFLPPAFHYELLSRGDNAGFEPILIVDRRYAAFLEAGRSI